MTSLELIATASTGLEAVVGRELRALGYEPRVVQPGWLLFEGDAAAIARSNLWLRTAERVLIRLGTFPATDFGQLFDGTFALPWDQWLPADAEFPVNGRSVKSQLSSVPACQKIVKKAIVEKLRAAHGVETLDETGPRVVVEVALLENQATLVIDTTGAGLHKRGYRKLSGRAPLRETLAAAMVKLSYWRPDRPLIDPFCGTGTIPIEAALIGRNMAPGLQRTFAAEDWPALAAELWTEARCEARDLAKPNIPGRIIGTDVDGEVLSLARYHAQQAGVDEQIHFQRRDFADMRGKGDYGCVICNPPYGERMSDAAEVERLYRSMPEVLRGQKTWSHYILTSHENFEQIIGQKADRRRKLYNGNIRCTYFQFHGPKPTGRIEVDVSEPETEEGEIVAVAPAPAFGGLKAGANRQAVDFANRLKKRARHLRRWPSRGITCYRLYERDVPEVPLVIDRYEDRLHVVEYERPHDRTPAEHADWLDMLLGVIGQTLDVPRDHIYMKRHSRQRGKTQHQHYDDRKAIFSVGEGGLKFLVNLSDYLDTGLFLDHRITRQMVRDEAADKRFLNLFGYTGSFTVYAAAGGAKSTTTVDRSNTYLAWAEKNLMANELAGSAHRLIRGDAMEFLAGAARGEMFDLAVVDPPTFSNRKDEQTVWDVQRDHVELLTRLLQHISPGGVIYFSTNFRRFKFAGEQLPGVTLREISRKTVPEDFRNQRIHRCWRIVRDM
ncbi:MAG: bifunctional 23S rRNA (guanine(2069)-N(7))-methyltransferase RlmK/23S rRNA (guanine(2445)-N(2))-methyltransferase RlmL [Planctomycetes bacterium]|nr:bifunctional 23S rRNA (guanine(2069)-N(7))-methyltransferase RlmK/23S rRNA (guanine(2445)-N(2))-methyltransferase RlmL [Planctomycetota bacterium]